MALLRDVIYKRGPPLTKLIQLEAQKVNLKPLKKIVIKFDPFSENVKSIRDFSFHLNSFKVLQTNQRCIIKTEILTDRSESSATFTLTDGQDIVVKCDNLNCLEIFQVVNKFITPLAPKDDLTDDLTAVKKKGKKK